MPISFSPYFYPCEKESDSIETFFHCWFLSAYYCPPLSWKNFYSTNLSIFSIFLFKSQKKKALCGLSYQLWILKFFKHIKTSCCLYCVNFRADSFSSKYYDRIYFSRSLRFFFAVLTLCFRLLTIFLREISLLFSCKSITFPYFIKVLLFSISIAHVRY